LMEFFICNDISLELFIPATSSNHNIFSFKITIVFFTSQKVNISLNPNNRHVNIIFLNYLQHLFFQFVSGAYLEIDWVLLKQFSALIFHFDIGYGYFHCFFLLLFQEFLLLEIMSPFDL